MTRQLAGWLLLSALLHAEMLSILGPARAPTLSTAPARLEIRIENSRKTGISDPTLPVETAAPPLARFTIAEANGQWLSDPPSAFPETQLPFPVPLTETEANDPLSTPQEIAQTNLPDSSSSPNTSPTLQLPIQEYFFKSSELDEQPYPLISVLPAYPPHAQVHNLEGWVRLLLLIDAGGRLRHLEVLEASPPGIFEESARAAFRITPFSPGRRGGEAVNCRMIIKIDFTLTGIERARLE
ncbi:MAG: energy transducer TonB [Accumulibacter sp.]|jgi:protein TonB|uniref:energy transducer TonB n=1 Tax=Accumulibacter sp. TaxID=2053492 RepID=UPI002FC2FA88